MKIVHYTWADPALYDHIHSSIAVLHRLLVKAELDTPELLLYLSTVRVALSRRMVRTAGTANYRTNRITLNAALFALYPDALTQTFVHETAHLLAYRLHHHRGHGKPWRQIMLSLGQEPIRCHTLDISRLVSGRRKLKQPRRYTKRSAALTGTVRKAALRRIFLETTRQLKRAIRELKA